MNKIAEAAAHASISRVEATASLAEIRHRAELAVHRPTGVPAPVQRVARRLRRVLVLEPRVHVPHEVVVCVVADDELFEFAVAAQLAPEVLVEGVEVVQALLGREPGFRVVRWVLVH